MKTNNSSLFHLFAIAGILSACHSDKPQIQQVKIYYSNGSLFCEGAHFYSDDKKDTIRVGVWKFYFPSKQLESEQEYDEKGELNRLNEYSDRGVLLASSSKKDNLWIQSQFYESGKLKSETVTQTDEGEYQTLQTANVKEYYSSGRLFSESHYIDGLLDGTMTRWDSSGNIVLKVNYRRGLVQK